MADLKERLEGILSGPTDTVAQAERAARAAEALAAYLRLEASVGDLFGLAVPTQETPADPALADLTLHAAAEVVLREAGVPLHVRELGKRIKAGGWRHRRSTSPRPDQILYQLAARLPRHPEVFVRVAPNTFALQEWERTTTDRVKPRVGLFGGPGKPTGRASADLADEIAASGQWRSS